MFRVEGWYQHFTDDTDRLIGYRVVRGEAPNIEYAPAGTFPIDEAKEIGSVVAFWHARNLRDTLNATVEPVTV